MTNDLTNPRGERRCMVGVDQKGENAFEPFVRAAWADTEIEQLQTRLEKSQKAAAAGEREIERLQASLTDAQKWRDYYRAQWLGPQAMPPVPAPSAVEPTAEYESVGYLYEFSSPWGGTYWDSDASPRNGSAPLRMRQLFAKRLPEKSLQQEAPCPPKSEKSPAEAIDVGGVRITSFTSAEKSSEEPALFNRRCARCGKWGKATGPDGVFYCSHECAD